MDSKTLTQPDKSRAIKSGHLYVLRTAPVYLPGVIDPKFATALEIHAGENGGGFDFTTASGHLRARRIRGNVINGVNGQPAKASIVVVPRTTDSIVFAPTAQSADDGSFEIKGVTTGSYFLYAAVYAAGGNGEPLENPGSAAARFPIEIGDRDVENLRVVVVPNFTIPVRLRFENGNSGQPAPISGNLNLSRNPAISFPFSTGLKPSATGDWDFQGVGPGDYRISRSGPGYIRSAHLGSEDVLKDGLHLDRQPEEQLEVVISMTMASVDGRVTDNAQVASNAVVVLVPSPDLRLRSDLYRYGTTDGNGHFQIQLIPPGDYKVFAWKDIEPDSWQDPDVLQRYENQGQPVSITSDSKLNIDLRLIP